MKQYTEEIKPGLKIIYDGEPKEWINPRTRKVCERMNKGKYIVSRVGREFIYIKADRKNASTEHKFHINDIKLWQPEFADMTTAIGFLFSFHHEWYINDEELIAKAKKYNKKTKC